MPSGDESAYVAFMDRISHADLTPEELNQPEPKYGPRWLTHPTFYR